MSPLPEQDHAPDPRFPVEWLCERCEGSDGQVVGERPEAFQSALRQVRALRSLGRREAPAELDGLVVASLEAGARQRRAAEQVAYAASAVATAAHYRIVDASLGQLDVCHRRKLFVRP